MPARAPASMLMLQTVMRPSIDRRSDGVARVLDDVARRAGRADLADDGEDDVFGRDAPAQLAVDADLHRLGPGLRQRLGRQDVLDLAGADAEGQRAERAVGAGVAVAADDGHARLGQAQFRADDVDDALPPGVEVVERDAELLAVLRTASPSASWRSGPRWAASGRSSARCGPSWRPSGRGGGPCARSGAGPRTPAARSLHGPGAGQCTAAPAGPASSRTTCCSQIFSNIVFGIVFDSSCGSNLFAVIIALTDGCVSNIFLCYNPYSSRYGTETSALFCGRRRGTALRAGGGEAAHRPAAAQPADPAVGAGTGRACCFTGPIAA